MPPPRAGQRGFTLAEAVIVIVITGIIAAMVAVFIRAPIQGYVDSARRAEMTDAADTAARRISRDLRLALPNSVRVFGGSSGTSVEFLLTRSGGRYRADAGAAGDDPLDFSGSDSSFDILGAPITFASGDSIAIYNLGIPGADAYAGDTLRAYNGTTGAAVGNAKFTPSMPFPFDSPGHRFQVVEGPVTYRCDGGQLRRHAGYVISAAQPDPPGGASALLANNVSDCLFTYDVINQRFGLLTIRLALSQGGETVGLYHEVHVNNVP
ncbi:MAG TPA: prepilin-type N-terminal cleavage/methylation domain-containing protein [Burkholderiaceae bacterium]|nr:prepilin-type N-terminal cleavage/methylation domain-containing protein [Burkholderiaceae bacterium]